MSFLASMHSERRWSGSAGAALSVAIHVAVIAAVLAARVPHASEPPPIQVRIISDTAPPAQHQHVHPERPILQKPVLHMPRPELVLDDPTPSHAPVSVATAAPPAPHRHAHASLQSRPRFDADYLNNPAPHYPPLSRRLHEEGVVLVRVHVAPDGSPDIVELKRSSGSERLDESALAAVRKWRFVPAKRGSETVGAWVIVPISFSLTA